MDKLISKYIHQDKYITNEYPNKFALEKEEKKWANEHICTNIFEYPKICPTLQEMDGSGWTWLEMAK